MTQPHPHLTRRNAFTSIIRLTAAYYGISVEGLLGPNKSPVVCKPRQVAMALCYRIGFNLPFVDHSCPIVGRFFRRDHTTVLHGYKKVELGFEAEAVETITNKFWEAWCKGEMAEAVILPDPPPLPPAPPPPPKPLSMAERIIAIPTHKVVRVRPRPRRQFNITASAMGDPGAPSFRVARGERSMSRE